MRVCAREYEAADAEAEAALKASPSFPEALRAKARVLELTGRSAEALQRLDAAIALRPTWARLYFERAMVLKTMNDAKASRRALLEAKKRDPDLLEAVLQLGVLEEESGDWVAAEKAYRAVLKADADHREARRMLAGVYLSTGKLDAADEQAKWIQQRFPSDPEAWTTSGRVAWKQDRFDDALAAFAKALEADPKYALAHLGRGWVLEDQDKKDEALKAYEQAVAADPKLPLPHRYWAELLETNEDKKNALVHYKAYLDLGGEDPDEDVKHAVERLSK
jgi:tetratricopeptide (TPR) repeat protein